MKPQSSQGIILADVGSVKKLSVKTQMLDSLLQVKANFQNTEKSKDNTTNDKLLTAARTERYLGAIFRITGIFKQPLRDGSPFGRTDGTRPLGVC